MTRSWIVIGAVAGMIAALAYPTIVFIPLPLIAVVGIASVCGLSISIASVGLYHLIALDRKSVSLQIGAASNVIAGILFNCMIIVQLSVNTVMESVLAKPPANLSAEMLRMIWDSVDQVQLGIDIAWDVYLCFGTLLVAWNMRKHPRFRVFFWWSGVIISLLLMVFNLVTFPTPPGQSGLVDLGPILGLWYFVVGIQVVRSIKWADRILEQAPNISLERRLS
ncbi:MAG: hypothetical protein GY847_35085 [Proteobacteria bacterium]|nr:hypothetical protein [Pseudomonadota bacterium]